MGSITKTVAGIVSSRAWAHMKAFRRDTRVVDGLFQGLDAMATIARVGGEGGPNGSRSACIGRLGTENGRIGRSFLMAVASMNATTRRGPTHGRRGRRTHHTRSWRESGSRLVGRRNTMDRRRRSCTAMEFGRRTWNGTDACLGFGRVLSRSPSRRQRRDSFGRKR